MAQFTDTQPPKWAIVYLILGMLIFDKDKGIIANHEVDVMATGNRTTSSNDSGMTLTVVKEIFPHA